SRTWRDGDSLHGNITIRVPAGDFGNIMTAIGNLSVEVVSSTTSSKDVTEEYVDLTARLKNLEATEAQLLRILEKAEKVDEILNVQRELSRTRSDIEQTKARMQYLERTSATSLINVSLEQARLSVKFTANKRFVKTGERVQFISQIAGGFAPYSHEWDFGDGKTSTDAAPIHAYSVPGSYTVTLKLTDDRGNTTTQTQKDYITIQPGWSAARTLDNAIDGLTTFGRVLANVFIWLGIFSPVWIIIGGILFWQLRRRKAGRSV
ncbi:MAG: DUF4349 domain-containing protein, partial [Chloroflexi bacterium]|nr:DUF4349 domain-containing protein [Chloroflexota bacterium]